METSVILNVLKKTSVWKNLVQLPERMEKVENEIIELKKLVECKSDVKCPKCFKFTWSETSHKYIKSISEGNYYLIKHKCSECGHENEIKKLAF